MSQLLDSMATEQRDQRSALLAFRSAFAAESSAAARLAQFRQLSALHAAGDWEALLAWLKAACCAAGLGGSEDKSAGGGHGNVTGGLSCRAWASAGGLGV